MGAEGAAAVGSAVDDRRTVEELFVAALQGDYDDEAPWEAIRELHLQRPMPEVFRLASGYSHSPIPLERTRALDVLGQLGCGKPDSERPYMDQSVAIAEDRLNDDDPDVVYSAAWALSHLKIDQAVSALIRVRDNPDPDVRWAVVCGMDGNNRVDAIQTLIDLMEDADDNVRDWATFGLGTQHDEDSGEIRRALHNRLNDACEETRNEAIWGLARRRDQTGLRLLLQRLETDHWSGDETTASDVLDLDDNTPIEDLRAGLHRLLS